MLFKQAVEKLEEQEWMAIAIELLIVIIGVFLGTQVSNWNNTRLEQGKTEQMVRDLKPELGNQARSFRIIIGYYAATRRYGETAFAGWRSDPRVSDRDFVIAAYQSSQIIFSGTNYASWSQIFGSERLRDLKNPRLREPLATLMTSDVSRIEAELSTDYRRDIRMLVPEEVQEAIRARCGDQRRDGAYLGLPRTCTLNMPDARFTAAALVLRAHPKLVGELRYHFAITEGYVDLMRTLDDLTRVALREI